MEGKGSLCSDPMGPGGDTLNPCPPGGPAPTSYARAGLVLHGSPARHLPVPHSPGPFSAHTPVSIHVRSHSLCCFLSGRWALLWLVSHFLPLWAPHSGNASSSPVTTCLSQIRAEEWVECRSPQDEGRGWGVHLYLKSGQGARLGEGHLGP